jgi:hypothetical protein
MRKTSEELIAQLRDADPSPASVTQGWSGTEAGRDTADRVRGEMAAGPERDEASGDRRRRGPLLLAAALLALLAVSASFAILERRPATTSVAGCYASLDQEGSSTVSVTVPSGASASDACSREWRRIFGVAAPPRLVECVVSGGGIGVFPYPASMARSEACSSIGAVLPDLAETPGG